MNSKMEKQKLISKFRELIEAEYYGPLLDNIRKGWNFLLVDFSKISKFDNDLADFLLDNPEEAIESAELAILEFDLEIKGVKFRVSNLPNSCRIPIWEIRDELIKFVKVEGYAIELGDILLRPLKIKFECPLCGKNMVGIRTNDFDGINPPKKCMHCHKNTKLSIVKVENTFIRKIIIEEDIMELGSQMPKKKIVLLSHDLNSKEIEKELGVGRKVIINGWLKTVEVNTRTGDMNTYLIANSIEFLERGWGTIKLTKAQKESTIKLSKDKDVIKKMTQSIIPTIHGNEEAKESLFLQMLGSDNVYDSDGFLEDRGCLHLGFIGPPGTGKSYMARKVGKFWPIYRFTSAKTSSGRGLIAAAVQEKDLDKKWVLVPGVFPTCHKGMCVIDELDKIDENDCGFLNNAMNELKVYVDKVVHGVFDTDTATVATMNPIGRVFIPQDPVYKQIALPEDLLDRFDLIFPIYGMTEEEEQRKVFRMGLSKRTEKEKIKPIYDKQTVINYVAYARTIKPKIPTDMKIIIEDRVIKFMRPNTGGDRQVSNRVFGVIFRLIYAYARAHLRTEITVDDLNKAMDLLVYSYREQGLLTDNGLFDFAKTEHVDINAANSFKIVKAKIKELSEEKKVIPIGDVVSSLSTNITEDVVEENIEKLKKIGDLFEPRRGFIQLI